MITLFTDNHPRNPYVGKGKEGLKHPLRGKYTIQHWSLEQLKNHKFTKHQFLMAGFNTEKGRYQAGDMQVSLTKHNWNFRDGQLMLIADIDGKHFESSEITLPSEAEAVYSLLTTLNPLLDLIKKMGA